MGPNIEDIEVKFDVENSFVQAALPYNKASYQKFEENDKETESHEVTNDETTVIEEEEESDPLRVTTRARYSYELDRYSKNAMLIFEGNASDVGFEQSDQDCILQSDDLSTKFKQTFEQFRFEVEIHRNLTDEEISSICERFFHRDFTEYGCVAVMMLAKTREGIVETCHTPNSEFGVMRYMTDLMPPSLQDKPKIYIVQTEGYYVIPRARVWTTLPRDNLEFRLTVPIVSAPNAHGKRSKVCCLLEFVYEKINSLGDQTDFHTILYDAVNEFSRRNQLYDLPVGFYSSLSKELRLFKTSEP